MVILSLLLNLASADFCPPLVELQVYDQVLEGLQISERDHLRFSEDLKNKALTPEAAAPDLKDFLKRDIQILKQSLTLKTVTQDQKKKAEALLTDLEKSPVANKDLSSRLGEISKLTQENLNTYQKIFNQCRKPGNTQR